jgi:hypothetical protein
MTQAVYRPRFRKQLTGSPLGHANCGPASAADLADRWSLGAINKTADQMRVLTGDVEGGTTVRQLATALAKVGVPLTIFDYDDGMDRDRFRSLIRSGVGAITNIDYSPLPEALEADKNFEDLHSTYTNEWSAKASLYTGGTGPGFLVYDPLADGRRAGIPKGPNWWPESVLFAALEAFPGGGWTVGTWTKRTVRKRASVSSWVWIRPRPTRAAAPIGKLTTQVLQHGGYEIGESVGGDKRWYRVWIPSTSRIAYVHASVVAATA